MDPTIKRVERDLTDLQRSLNTKRCYTQILYRLQRHYGCPLDELGPEEVRDYLRMLIRSPEHGFATYGAYVAAVRFCYSVTLARHEVVAGIKSPRMPHKVPVIMTQEEVLRCLKALTCERDRALIMLAYGGGLRISEEQGVPCRRLAFAAVEHALGGRAATSALSPATYRCKTSTPSGASSASTTEKAANNVSSCSPRSCSLSCAGRGVSSVPKARGCSRASTPTCR